MKNSLIIVCLLIMVCLTANAQRKEQGERVHALKMVYITDRLHLSPEQSTNFVPLYNEYEGEQKKNFQEFKAKYKGMENDALDDNASRKFVDDNLDFQEHVIAIKRKYNDRFLKIISPQQLADLYKSEREFNQMLRKRLNERRNGGGGGNGGGRWGDFGR